VFDPLGVFAGGAMSGDEGTVAGVLCVGTTTELELEPPGARLSALVGGAATTDELPGSLLEGPSELPAFDSVEHAVIANNSAPSIGAAVIGAADATVARGDGSTSVRRFARETMVRMTVVVTLCGNTGRAARIACRAQCRQLASHDVADVLHEFQSECRSQARRCALCVLRNLLGISRRLATPNFFDSSQRRPVSNPGVGSALEPYEE
jgi:hypothetical protein